MPEQAHALQVFRSSADNSAVVSGRGWLDETTCDMLQSAIDEALDSGVERLRVDLLELDGIDDAGLRCLVATSARCHAAGIGLQIEASDPIHDALAAGAVADEYPG
jgi:anti-anti-sigma regulatory factor